MRKIFLFFLMTVSMLFSFSSPAIAQDIPDDEEVIVVDITHNTTETGPKRSPAIIPISANYYVLSSCLEILFLYDIGDVTISMTNLTTGYNSITIVDSFYGGAILPILSISGLWEIVFSTEGGDIYVGSFIIP